MAEGKKKRFAGPLRTRLLQEKAGGKVATVKGGEITEEWRGGDVEGKSEITYQIGGDQWGKGGGEFLGPQ